MKTLTENDSSDTEYVQLKFHGMKIKCLIPEFQIIFLFFILLYLRARWMVRWSTH